WRTPFLPRRKPHPTSGQPVPNKQPSPWTSRNEWLNGATRRSALRPLCLKIEFQTQLYFARRRSQKCNRAERAATEIGIGRSEVWVIKYIEGFKSKFHEYLPADAKAGIP